MGIRGHKILLLLHWKAGVGGWFEEKSSGSIGMSPFSHYTSFRSWIKCSCDNLFAAALETLKFFKSSETLK